MGAKMTRKDNAIKGRSERMLSCAESIRIPTIDRHGLTTKSRIRIVSIMAACCLLLVAFAWSAPSRAESTTYYVTNAQGTVVAEMDTGSNVTYDATYRPYGQQQNGTPQAGPGYTGHVNDPDTGLVYMQARYYDPGVGRFLSVDPVQIVPSDIFNFNSYDYTNNNPVINVDPDGRCSDADGSCGRMVQHYGVWAYNHPKQADWIGEHIGAPGVGVMLLVSGGAALVAEPAVVGRIFFLMGSFFGTHPGTTNKLINFDPEGQIVEVTSLLKKSTFEIELEGEILANETEQEKNMILASFGSLNKKGHDGIRNGPPYTAQQSDVKKNGSDNNQGSRYMNSGWSNNYYYDRKHHKWQRVPISQYK